MKRSTALSRRIAVGQIALGDRPGPLQSLRRLEGLADDLGQVARFENDPELLGLEVRWGIVPWPRVSYPDAARWPTDVGPHVYDKTGGFGRRFCLQP